MTPTPVPHQSERLPGIMRDAYVAEIERLQSLLTAERSAREEVERQKVEQMERVHMFRHEAYKERKRAESAESALKEAQRDAFERAAGVCDEQAARLRGNAERLNGMGPLTFGAEIDRWNCRANQAARSAAAIRALSQDTTQVQQGNVAPASSGSVPDTEAKA
jgi:vacuolar-type H+-ATPase subunit H